MFRVPTTDQMDSTTPEERYKLMLFCENELEWHKYDGKPETWRCPKCGGKASHQVGFQPLSQRTYNPTLHNPKKFKKRLR